MAKWYNVNKIVQVWEGHAEKHKMGRLHPPAGVNILNEYQGSGRFDPDEVRFEGDGHWEDREDDPSYKEFWVQMKDLSLEQYDPSPEPTPVPVPEPLPVPEPVPSNPGDEILGRAVMVVFNALASAFRGPSSSNVN